MTSLLSCPERELTAGDSSPDDITIDPASMPPAPDVILLIGDADERLRSALSAVMPEANSRFGDTTIAEWPLRPRFAIWSMFGTPRRSGGLRIMSCWISSGASKPNAARLPMFSLMTLWPCSSICRAASMMGPRIS